MARLYADEQFPQPVIERLRAKEHDILTVREAGRSNLKIPDAEVLAFATQEQRAVLTLNRVDFIKLHYQSPEHSGIIVCRDDRNWDAFADRIDIAIRSFETLSSQLIPVNRQ
ncbi:DUF5615 family PIN-like protein [Baaleninema sp.]|uniref:DUF5615 family PIN-like protein n=1 Tax=Baaleninema sp. TaxID=3101197 RepID=UPI003CFF1CE4